jgi:hypothetical protein
MGRLRLAFVNDKDLDSNRTAQSFKKDRTHEEPDREPARAGRAITQNRRAGGYAGQSEPGRYLSIPSSREIMFLDSRA